MFGIYQTLWLSSPYLKKRFYMERLFRLNWSMVERCKNCGSRVYLEGRYCPYCGSEFKGYKEEKFTPRGEKIAFVLATFISLCYLIPSTILMYAIFTHVYLVPFEILIFFILLALFMLLASGRIVNKVLSKKEFYEPQQSLILIHLKRY